MRWRYVPKSTGTAAAATFDAQAFAARHSGTLQTTTAAQNAIVSVGGVGGFQVTSPTNAVTGLLPGVTVDLSQVSTTPVTLTVSRRRIPGRQPGFGASQCGQPGALDHLDRYGVQQSTNTAGPLNGQTSLNELAQQVLSIVGRAVGTSGAGSDGTAGESAGLAITSSGTITFNQTAFDAAYDAHPTAVQAMFTEGGTFSPSASAYGAR